MPFNRLNHALKGVRSAARGDTSVRIHLFIAALVLIAGVVGCISLSDWLFLFLAIFLVLAAELFNSALEHLADNLHPGQHPGVGEAKDIAAGAVLVTAVFALIVGMFVFLPALYGGRAGSCLVF